MVYKLRLGNETQLYRRATPRARCIYKGSLMLKRREAFEVERVTILYCQERDHLVLESPFQRWDDIETAERRYVLLKDVAPILKVLDGKFVKIWAQHSALTDEKLRTMAEAVLCDLWRAAVGVLAKHLDFTALEKKRFKPQDADLVFKESVEFKLPT